MSTDDEFLAKWEADAFNREHLRLTAGDASRLYVLAGLGPVIPAIKEKYFHVRSALIAPLVKKAIHRIVVSQEVHGYRCPLCDGSGLPELDVYFSPEGPCPHCDGNGWWDYSPCERTYGIVESFTGTQEEVEAWARGPEPEADMVALVDWRQGSADQWGEELVGKVEHHFTSGRSIPEEHQAAHAKFLAHPHQYRLLRKILRGLGAY